MKKSKRIISLLLSAVMLLSTFSGISFSAMAAPIENNQDPNSIKSVQLITQEPIKVTEYTNGTFEVVGPENKSMFLYDIHNLMIKPGNKVVVTYNSGTTEEYVANSREYAFVNNKNERLNIYQRTYEQANKPWVIGNNTAILDVNGFTFECPVEVVKSNVASVKFVPTAPIEIMENTCGYKHQIGPDNSLYVYEGNKIVQNAGNKMVVTYKDGNEETFECHYEGSPFHSNNGQGVYPEYDWTEQLVNSWKPNQTNLLPVYFMGVKVDVPVKVNANTISSVEFVPAKPIKIIENTCGDFDTFMSDTPKFRYHMYEIIDGVGNKFIFKHNDGSPDEEYVYNPNSGRFENSKGEGLDYISKNYDSNYPIGQNSVELLINDSITSTVNFEIVETPVKSVEVKLAKPIELLENTNGHWSDNGSPYQPSDRYFYYEVNTPELINNSGNSIIVTLNDGTRTEYRCQYYGNFTEVGNPDNVLDIIKYSTQNTEHWLPNKDNYFYVSVMGKSQQVPITIKPDIMESIEFVPAQPIQVEEHTSGYFQKNGEEILLDKFDYYLYDYINAVGNKLIVNNNDGTKIVYDYDENQGGFVNGTSEPVHVMLGNEQYSNPFKVGKNKISLSAFDKTCYVDVEITPSTLSYIEFKQLNPIQIEEDTYCNIYEFSYDTSGKYSLGDILDSNSQNVIVAHYVDGSSDVFVQEFDNAGLYKNQNNEEILVDYNSGQANNPWKLGDNEFTVYFRQCSAKGKITIVPSDIKNIEYASGSVKTYEGWGCSYYDTDFAHHYDTSDLKIKINKKDGTSDIVPVNSEYDGFDVYVIDEQKYTPWESGKANYLKVVYRDKEIQIPVEFAKPTISNLELVKAPTVTEYYLDYAVSVVGAQIRVTYTNGTSKLVTVGKDDIRTEPLVFSIDENYYEVKYYFNLDGNMAFLEAVNDSNGNTKTTISCQGVSFELNGIKYNKPNSDIAGIELKEINPIPGNESPLYNVQISFDVIYTNGLRESFNSKYVLCFGGGENEFGYDSIGYSVLCDQGYIYVIIDIIDITNDTIEYKLNTLGFEDTLVKEHKNEIVNTFAVDSIDYVIVECKECHSRRLALANPVTGHWEFDGIDWCYIDAQGVKVTNAWVKDNSKNDVYVNGDGHIVRNIWLHDGVDWVHVDADGHKQVNTWLRDNNNQFIYVNENGYISRNTWIKDHSNTDVYVNQDGYIVRNTWLKDNTDWFFVDADGHKIVSTWLRDNNYQFIYVNENGYITRNTWIKDHSNSDVYVNQDGYIVRNAWVKDNSKNDVYVNADGRIVRDTWLHDGVDWVNVDADGHKVVNTWLRDNNYQFIYVNENGYISRNTWVKDHSNTDVYVNQDGYIVRNTWLKDNTDWFFVDADGHKQVNTWLRDNNYQFIYVNENGYISRNTWVKDHSNTDVYVNQDGHIVRSTWLKDSTDWFYVDADGHKQVNTWLRDNNYQFVYADKNGHITRNTWIKDHSDNNVYVDRDGHIVRNAQVTTPDGKNVSVDQDGHIK